MFSLPCFMMLVTAKAAPAADVVPLSSAWAVCSRAARWWIGGAAGAGARDLALRGLPRRQCHSNLAACHRREHGQRLAQALPQVRHLATRATARAAAGAYHRRRRVAPRAQPFAHGVDMLQPAAFAAVHEPGPASREAGAGATHRRVWQRLSRLRTVFAPGCVGYARLADLQSAESDVEPPAAAHRPPADFRKGDF